MNMLMGRASAIQLGDLLACSYAPLAEALARIVPREIAHARLGEAGLRRAIEHDGARLAAAASIAYWYPRVAATFGRSDSERFDLYRKYGLRRHTNAELLQRWRRIAARAREDDARLPPRAPASVRWLLAALHQPP